MNPFKRNHTRALATLPDATRSTQSPIMTGGYAGNVTSLLSMLQGTTSPEFRSINEAGVFGLPAAWRAVNLIANAVALMLNSADVCDEQGNELELVGFLDNPNSLYNGPYEFWFEAVVMVVLHGNAIFVRHEDELIPVHPLNVECKLSPAGPTYRMYDMEFSRDEILHVRGLTVPGNWWGMGAVEAHRINLLGSTDMQAMSHSTYNKSSVPSVVIGVDQNLTQEQAEMLKANWIAAMGSGQKLPAVISKGMSVTPITWTPEDAQFLEARQFNIAETAFIFNLDPTDLSATFGSSSGTNQTYANIEQRNQERITATYGQWLLRFEQALSKLLPEGQYVKGKVEALLRTDTKTRMETYKLGLEMGLYNEKFAQDKEGIKEEYRSVEKPQPPTALPAPTDSGNPTDNGVAQ